MNLLQPDRKTDSPLRQTSAAVFFNMLQIVSAMRARLSESLGDEARQYR
jgi:hypothetical protein